MQINEPNFEGNNKANSDDCKAIAEDQGQHNGERSFVSGHAGDVVAIRAIRIKGNIRGLDVTSGRHSDEKNHHHSKEDAEKGHYLKIRNSDNLHCGIGVQTPHAPGLGKERSKGENETNAQEPTLCMAASNSGEIQQRDIIAEVEQDGP